MIRTPYTFLLFLFCLATICYLPSCNSDKKDKPAVSTVDTTTPVPSHPVTPISAPHGDTSQIPVLAKILDDALAASAKKDYASLAPMMLYRGPDMKRFGTDVFNLKSPHDKTVVRITADVFNKWNRNVETKEYSRIFEMDQPGNRKMVVLEVLFISQNYTDRKFFGFIKLGEEYKIADVTSFL